MGASTVSGRSSLDMAAACCMFGRPIVDMAVVGGGDGTVNDGRASGVQTDEVQKDMYRPRKVVHLTNKPS